MQEQPKPHSGPPPVLRGFLLKKKKRSQSFGESSASLVFILHSITPNVLESPWTLLFLEAAWVRSLLEMGGRGCTL